MWQLIYFSFLYNFSENECMISHQTQNKCTTDKRQNHKQQNMYFADFSWADVLDCRSFVSRLGCLEQKVFSFTPHWTGMKHKQCLSPLNWRTSWHTPRVCVGGGPDCNTHSFVQKRANIFHCLSQTTAPVEWSRWCSRTWLRRGTHQSAAEPPPESHPAHPSYLGTCGTFWTDPRRPFCFLACQTDCNFSGRAEMKHPFQSPSNIIFFPQISSHAKFWHCTNTCWSYCRNTGVVSEHETADSVCRLDVWRFPRQCHLNASWAPRYELRQLSFSYSLQAFVNLKQAQKNNSKIPRDFSQKRVCSGTTTSAGFSTLQNLPALDRPRLVWCLGWKYNSVLSASALAWRPSYSSVVTVASSHPKLSSSAHLVPASGSHDNVEFRTCQAFALFQSCGLFMQNRSPQCILDSLPPTTRLAQIQYLNLMTMSTFEVVSQPCDAFVPKGAWRQHSALLSLPPTTQLPPIS